MNMISTGAFLRETDASTKQSELVKKLTSAWEKKNSKKARAGGASLMALSLAACGGEDNTPFSAADVSAAEAAATTAALTGADGTVYASVDAAVTSNDTAIADAARAEGVASVDITSDNTEVMMSQADYDAAIAAADDEVQALYDALVASNATLQASYDALTTPSTVSLTDDDAAGVSPDAPAMTAGSDTISGDSDTFDAADVIVDSSTSDNDVITITATGDISATATVVNVETANFNLNSVAAAGGDGASTFDVDVANFSGTNAYNFDVTATGSAVTALAVDNLITGGVVNSTSDFTTVTVNADDNADYTVNLTAATATSVVTFNDTGATANDVAVVSTGALTVNGTVLDGDLTTTSAGDTIITESDESATVTSTSTAGSVKVVTADTATSLSLTAADEVDVEGADAATTITVAAAGTGATGSGTTASQVTATAMTTLNVSGNGGALKIDASDSDALAAVNVSGDQSVEVIVDGDELTAITDFAFTDTSTAGTSVLNINARAAGGNTIDLVDAAADVIKFTADMNADDLDVASGANLQIAADQTDMQVDGAYATRATNSVTVTINDDGESAESWDVTSFDADNMATVNLVSNETSEVSGGIDIVAIDVGTGVLNVSGSADFDFDSIVAGSVAAGDATGAIDIDLEGGSDVGTVTTGSGADTLTISADLTTGGYTLATGAGNDSIYLRADSDASVDGGAGTDTVYMDGDFSQETISITGVEVLELDDEATVDSSILTGQSMVVRDTGETSTDFNVTVDGATADLSGLTIDTSTTTATVIDASSGYGALLAVSITGTSVVDTITGGAKGDTIVSGSGADVVDGGAGADVIYGDAGADTLTGGAGGDTIYGGAAADILLGDNGGTQEVQTITVGTANGTIGETGTVSILGNSITFTSTGTTVTTDAADIAAAIEADSIADYVSATSALGVVTITYQFDADVAQATGASTAGATFTNATTTAGVSGTGGNDTIVGGEGADIIFAGDGTNTVDLTETTSTADEIYFTDNSDGVTTITNFAVNKDLLNFDGITGIASAGTNVAANAAELDPTDGAVLIFANGADGTGTSTDAVIEDYTDMVDVAAFLEACLSIAVSENFVALINDLAGDDVYIYNVTNDGATAAIASTDLDHIGIIQDIGATALDAGEIM